jgi:hypothetical protein
LRFASRRSIAPLIANSSGVATSDSVTAAINRSERARVMISASTATPRTTKANSPP